MPPGTSHKPSLEREKKKPCREKKSNQRVGRGIPRPPRWLWSVMCSTKQHLARHRSPVAKQALGSQWERRAKRAVRKSEVILVSVLATRTGWTWTWHKLHEDICITMKTSYCCNGEAAALPPPPHPLPRFSWKKISVVQGFLLNPPLPHLSPATSPSRAIGAQPEPRDPGFQPQAERKNSSALLPSSVQESREQKLRRKLLLFPVSQQCKLASQQDKAWTVHRERATCLAHQPISELEAQLWWDHWLTPNCFPGSSAPCSEQLVNAPAPP